MDKSIWGDTETQFFHELTPDIILNSVEELGYIPTGRCLALNSMENRVYEVEVEKGEGEEFLIIKFYRPGRWSKDQILEEHEFLFDLESSDIPVVSPFKLEGLSLFKCSTTNLYYSISPKMGGRMAQDLNLEQLEIVGRTLARLHNVGESKKSHHRLTINSETFAKNNLNYLITHHHIPEHLKNKYSDLVQKISDLSDSFFQTSEKIRIHGDCHWGNMIVRDDQIYLIDFDDMLVGPPVQDLWLIEPGFDEESLRRREIILSAYEQMRSFDRSSLKYIELLRALRFIHFSSWIAKRWNDQAFKNAFPHFGDVNYWDVQINDLQNQINIFNQMSGQYSYE